MERSFLSLFSVILSLAPQVYPGVSLCSCPHAQDCTIASGELELVCNCSTYWSPDVRVSIRPSISQSLSHPVTQSASQQISQTPGVTEE